ELARRASWPAPVAGQLGRFVNAAGDRYTGSTAAPVRAGYRFEAALGAPVPAEAPGTRPLYSCAADGDLFTSAQADCEGGTVLGETGRVYVEAPAGVPTVPLYRCAAAGDRFDSRRVDCGGATRQVLLGHARAYAALARYNSRLTAEHVTTVDGVPPSYYREGSFGWLALAAEPGTTPLTSCLADTDQFLSTDPGCEGKTVLGHMGHVWTSPPAGLASAPIYACRINGERFVSRQSTCEGFTVDGQLGHVLTALPTL
ncbi:MAG TPA: hypothetical protein VNV66_00675, partial [Pilimelia sp.]|nr:hypothetical protein [Pilimelia sp.]